MWIIIYYFLLTDGDYYNFDFMRHIRKKFKEDIHSDKDSDKLPDYFKILNLISSSIPVMLIFVPRILDDNFGIFTCKSEQKTIEDLKKEILTLKENQENMELSHQQEIKSLKDNQQKEIEQLKNNLKEMEKKMLGLLGKKTLRKKVHEENEESENPEESVEEKRKKKKKKNEEKK